MNTQPIQDLKKAILVLSKRKAGATKADQDRIDIEIEQLNVKLLNAQRNYFNSQVDSQLTKADMHGSILEPLTKTLQIGWIIISTSLTTRTNSPKVS